MRQRDWRNTWNQVFLRPPHARSTLWTNFHFYLIEQRVFSYFLIYFKKLGILIHEVVSCGDVFITALNREPLSFPARTISL